MDSDCITWVTAVGGGGRPAFYPLDLQQQKNQLQEEGNVSDINKH
jgi:hypothetical protein